MRLLFIGFVAIVVISVIGIYALEDDIDAPAAPLARQTVQTPPRAPARRVDAAFLRARLAKIARQQLDNSAATLKKREPDRLAWR